MEAAFWGGLSRSDGHDEKRARERQARGASAADARAGLVGESRRGPADGVGAQALGRTRNFLLRAFGPGRAETQGRCPLSQELRVDGWHVSSDRSAAQRSRSVPARTGRGSTHTRDTSGPEVLAVGA